jgi:phospholipid-binding lipoprotein MlaA
MRSVLFGLAGLAASSLWPAVSAAAAPDDAPPDAASPPAPAAKPVRSAPADTGPQIYDPWERANRGIYKFNDGLDRAVLRPAALGYKRALPRPVRTGVRNVINNIGEPNTLMNDLLQGRVALGSQSAARFVINSTIGIAGIFDVARPLGIPGHDSDFGQTLGRWGVPTGPYLFVPVFGPTDLRDGTGRIIDGFASILSLHDLHVTTPYRVGITVVDGVDTRLALDPEIQQIRHTATDPYATERSAYLQYRRSRVVDSSKAVDQLPSFDAPPPATAAPKANHQSGSN